MEKTKVRTLIRQVRGVSYKPEDLHNELDDNSVILLRANNIDEGKINFDDVVYVDKSKVSDEQYLKDGDILICASSGSKNLVGKAASIRLNMECTFGAFCKVVRPKEGIEEYLGVYFQSPIYRRKISEVAIGANINNIRNEHIDELDIPVFSNDEQVSIAKRMHLIQEVISNRKAELEKLDDLIKARFVEMFGDPILNPNGYLKEKIEKHIDLLSGYPFKSEQYVEEGINICGGLIIMPQKIKWNECVHWSSAEGFEDYLLNENDIVMALDRPWISEGFKMAKVDAEHLPALLIQRTARIRAIDMNQEYLYNCFINGGFDKHSYVTGSLVPHISAKDIRSFEIMIPPAELQNQFADFVHQVDKSKVYRVKKYKLRRHVL